MNHDFKAVTVRLTAKEQRMLDDLLEHYRLRSHNHVMRASLHRMYFTMQQEITAQSAAAADTEAQREFWDSGEGDEEYAAYLEHIHTPRASEY